MATVISLIMAAILAFAHASTEVQRCTVGQGALPLSTTIEGCGQTPCSLPQLEDAVIHLTFDAPRRLESMTTLATAYLTLLGITIPIPYDLREASQTSNYLTNAQCPVDEGQLVNYTLRMYIESFFPVATSVTVEFQVVDEASDVVVCLRVPIRIVSPRQAIADNSV